MISISVETVAMRYHVEFSIPRRRRNAIQRMISWMIS
jgi:hypothetical protein